MIDRWHDYYHGDAPDYVNCPYCQEELMQSDPEWQGRPEASPWDRLKDVVI
jgi:hypothetical protein